MSPEQIQAIKEAHKEEFALKRAAGLTELQAAQSIIAQIEHDKAHPPGPIALGKARNMVEIFTSRFEQLKKLAQEALEAIAEAARLNLDTPGDELPSLPSFISGSQDTSLREALAKREQEVIELGAKVVELEDELAELKPRLAGLQLDHQALLKERDEATAYAAQLQEQLDTALSKPPETAKSKPKK